MRGYFYTKIIMVNVYLCDGIFEKKKIEVLDEVVSKTKENSDKLKEMPIQAIIEIFNKLSKSFITDSALKTIEGANFLALWLKRKNLIDMISLNLGDMKYFDDFVEVKENQYLKAQPRGLVCHWIAGNIPTLAIFSLIPSVLCRNANILRVPEQSVEVITIILKELNKLQIEYENKIYKGFDLVNSISIIYYPRTDINANNKLSLSADAKIVWGGKQAIEAIKALPTKEHCEDLLFGPKYSFGVFDKNALKSEEVRKWISNAVMDIIIFDQSACSSPQVLFFEKNDKLDIKQIAEILAEEFKKTAEKYPKLNLSAYTSTKIINARGEYLLDVDKDIISSKDADWTILINKNICLEEPIQSRTIFIKEVNHLSEIIPLITKKIQTVGIAIEDFEKTKEFCDKITDKGVARCVKFGSMNNYESPWDGMFVLNRLVRFVTIKK